MNDMNRALGIVSTLPGLLVGTGVTMYDECLVLAPIISASSNCNQSGSPGEAGNGCMNNAVASLLHPLVEICLHEATSTDCWIQTRHRQSMEVEGTRGDCARCT